MVGTSRRATLGWIALLFLARNAAPCGERAAPVEFFDVERMSPSRIATAVRQGRSVDLNYFGSTHRLVLEPSTLRSETFHASTGNGWEERSIYPERISTFRGEVAGDPGSMVRLSVTSRGIRGCIKSSEGWAFIEPLSDEDNRWGLIPAEEMHKVFTEADLDANFGGLMAADMVAAQGVSSDAAVLEDVSGVAPEAGPATSGATGALRVLELAVDADAEFVDACNQRGTAPVAEIESTLNIVDGIFQTELGIRLSLVYVHLWENEPDPYGSLDGLTLLVQCRDFWNTNRTDVVRDAVHLFTGKELNGSTVGMAYVSVVCSSNYAYALSQDLGHANAVLPILVAHEIAHNLGASHDQEGTTPRYIMYPSLSSLNLDEFSELTAGQIQDYTSTVSCLSLEEEEPTDPPPDDEDEQGSGGGGDEEVVRSSGGGGPVDPLLGALILTAWLSRRARRRRIS